MPSRKAPRSSHRRAPDILGVCSPGKAVAAGFEPPDVFLQESTHLGSGGGCRWRAALAGYSYVNLR